MEVDRNQHEGTTRRKELEMRVMIFKKKKKKAMWKKRKIRVLEEMIMQMEKLRP